MRHRLDDTNSGGLGKNSYDFLLFPRYDYEELEVTDAEKVLRHLSEHLSTWKGKVFGSLRIVHADNFEYRDPIDQTITSQQVGPNTNV